MSATHLQETEDGLVSGHIREKNGLYYIVLNLKGKGDNGKTVRKAKWIPTGLPIKGNKKRAEKLLMEKRAEYTALLSNGLYDETVPVSNNSADDATTEFTKNIIGSIGKKNMLFVEYLDMWLQSRRRNIRTTTYSAYESAIRTQIGPYFRELCIKLGEVTADNIQDFYAKQGERDVKNNTIIRYHAVIHKAIHDAVKKKLIDKNPMELVERPTPNKFIGKYYNNDDVRKLVDAANGTRLELIVMFAAFYGLRRSEILGLQWDAFDFGSDTFTVQRTVTSSYVDGKTVLVQEDDTKNKSSHRTMPLVSPFRERMLALQAEQAMYRKLCGRSYIPDFSDYIFVNEIGNLVRPSYITGAFQLLLAKNGLKKIRFHDLRHTCASLLLANGVSLKEVQEWIGHSDIATTGNIYAHLEF